MSEQSPEAESAPGRQNAVVALAVGWRGVRALRLTSNAVPPGSGGDAPAESIPYLGELQIGRSQAQA